MTKLKVHHQKYGHGTHCQGYLRPILNVVVHPAGLLTIIVADIQKANNTQGVDASCEKIRCPVVQLEVRDTCPEEQGCPELAEPYPLDCSRVSAAAAIVRLLVHVRKVLSGLDFKL